MCNVENIDSDNYMQIVNDDYNEHLNKIKQMKTEIEYIQNRFSSFQRYLIKQNACDFAITDELSLISSEYTNCITRYQTYVDSCLSNYYNLLNYELKKREIHKQTQQLVKQTKLENIRLKKRINTIKRQYINNNTELKSTLKTETIDLIDVNNNCLKKTQQHLPPQPSTPKTLSTPIPRLSSSPLPAITTTTTTDDEYQTDQLKPLTDNVRLIKCSNGLQYTYIDTCELSVSLRQFIENNQLTQTYVAESLLNIQGKRLQALINTPPTWVKCHEETRRLLTRIKLFLSDREQIDIFLKHAKKQQDFMKLNKNQHLETIDYSKELHKYDLNSYQRQKTTKELSSELRNILAKNSIKLDLFCNYGFDNEILSTRRVSHLLSTPQSWHKLNDMSKYYMIKISDWLKDSATSLNKLIKIRNSLNENESVVKAQLEAKERLNEQRLYESQLLKQQKQLLSSNDVNHQTMLTTCNNNITSKLSNGSYNYDESHNLPYPYDITKLENIEDFIQPHEIASKLREVLERECITKAEFARLITKSAQSTLFDLINKPKDWSSYSKLACDRFKAMYMWLQDEDRMSKIRTPSNDDSNSKVTITTTNDESINNKTMFHEIVDRTDSKSLTNVISKNNVQYLISIFNMNQYPNENEYEKMSHYLNIEKSKIKNWFRKRRFTRKNKINRCLSSNNDSICELSETITEVQLVELTKLFSINRYPDAITVQNLSNKLNLSIQTINKWFSMKRLDNDNNLTSHDYYLNNNNDDEDSDGDNEDINENGHNFRMMFDHHPEIAKAQCNESTKSSNISTDTRNNNNIQIEIDKIKVEVIEYHISE